MMSFLTRQELWHGPSGVWWAVLAFTVSYVWICRGRLTTRSCWFAAAMLVLASAFVSPIGALARGYMFSAHMIQHLLLLLIVPLFVMLSLPVREETETSSRLVNLAGRLPLLGWMAGLGAMWFWHVPSLCSAATESTSLGVIRSTTFLLAGLAFWLPIFAPLKSLRLPPLSAVVYLFSACLGCTLLGIYITFTSISVCPAFANPANTTGVLGSLRAAGFSASLDQQLGGLLMWVPPCSLYVCAIIGVLCRWYVAEAATAPVNASRGLSTLSKVKS
ncbi:MAG: cytochrome c oxidase assembly protein [Planctomycetota bacterium]